MRILLFAIPYFVIANACYSTDLAPSKTPENRTLRGIVKFKGKQIPAKPIVMATDPYCAKYYAGKKAPLSERWKWGKNDTLQNVVVYVSKGLPAGRKYEPPKKPAELKQKGCMYVPHVLVVQVDQKLRFENLDETLHNVHSLPRENKEY